ncbi:MAG TPA: hypothetical protein VGF30_01345 [Bacteroidia bacterium]
MEKLFFLILGLICYSGYAQDNETSTHTIIKVVKLPELVIEFSGSVLKGKSHTIKKSDIQKAELTIPTKDCIWYEIVSYDVTGNVNGKPKVASYRNSYNKYTYGDDMGKLSKEVVTGNSILVDNIKIKDVYGKIRNMPAMKIKITPG